MTPTEFQTVNCSSQGCNCHISLPVTKRFLTPKYLYIIISKVAELSQRVYSAFRNSIVSPQFTEIRTAYAHIWIEHSTKKIL